MTETVPNGELTVSCSSDGSGKIFVFCQPFIDQVYQCQPEYSSLLSKYGMAPNGSLLFPSSQFSKFDQDVKSASIPTDRCNGFVQKICCSTGGSGLNTARGTNLLAPGMVKFFGVVGTDHYGQEVANRLREDPLDALLLEADGGHTATCVILLSSNGKNRSMVSTLGCSMEIPPSFMEQIDFEQCSVFYLCAYMLDAPKMVIHRLLQKLAMPHFQSISFFFNLSAPFCLGNVQLITQLLPRIDVIFGNEEESREFYCKFSNSDTEPSLFEIAAFMSSHCTGVDQKERVTVITRGNEPTIAWWRGEMHEISLSSRYPNHPVVDTTGGGDCFAAGFMASFLEQKQNMSNSCASVDYTECIRKGHEFAEFIVKVMGIDFAKYPLYQ